MLNQSIVSLQISYQVNFRAVITRYKLHVFEDNCCMNEGLSPRGFLLPNINLSCVSTV